MSKTPESKYQFQELEKNWIKKWEEIKAYKPEVAIKAQKKSVTKSKPYSIVIPPPNITGDLHVGHALDQTLQDVCVRIARMRGYHTLWLPGTDHAGIATQVRVEQELKKENIHRKDLGREKFIERVWEWKKRYGEQITKQQRLLGLSLDWSRERFTMDEGLSEAVVAVFVELYRKGLIYRDTRLVNWDPESQTVLSDLEIEHVENFQTELYDFAYKLDIHKDATKSSTEINEIVVSTTRPETMLGDTAIAVHPDDIRYKSLIGKWVSHPFLNRKIKIIADSILVDPSFGSGAVKLTPAHDSNDYAAAKRHNLDFINIFDHNACINENGGKFKGLERMVARKAIKDELKKLGLERGSKSHTMSIAKSQRTGVVVEPILSTQWFVKAKPLAEKALLAVKKKKIQFKPALWTHTYNHWMTEIRDWCISRQLWWGHRIPAWYGPDKKIFVAKNEKEALKLSLKHYKKKVTLIQDEDVLDTWFSSALWPFSTLGWPKKTKDLKTFYPTTLLVTSYDIIFFWVARMIMFGLYFLKTPPFKTVYIHGLMRDEKGQKMSKTKGNGINPLEVMKIYGTDAFRFFLIATLSEGKDTLYSEQRLRGYQNFTNKIWNSSRFVLMNLPKDFQVKLKAKELLKLELEAEDFWILDRLNYTIKNLTKSIEDYKFHLSAAFIYDFFWHEFCDWYIEFVKTRLFAAQNIYNSDANGKSEDEKKKSKAIASAEVARYVLCYVLLEALALLHPFMPFITEELYSYFSSYLPKPGKNEANKEKILMLRKWPQIFQLPSKAKNSIQALLNLQEALKATRVLRAQKNIAPEKKIKVMIKTKNHFLKEVIQKKNDSLLRLAGASKIDSFFEHDIEENSVKQNFSTGEVFIVLDNQVSLEEKVRDQERIKQELIKVDLAIELLEKRLGNPDFVKNAPSAIVDKEKAKLKELKEKRNSLI